MLDFQLQVLTSSQTAITVILLAGSLLGRMNFYAWMLFVPLWLLFSYTVGASTIWGDGFLERRMIDYAGGSVIHLSSGVAGFTAAYWGSYGWDGQVSMVDLHLLLTWLLHWPFFNTHLCTATSLLVWVSLDMVFYRKSCVIGAVQGMITGLVCITPGAGILEPWAALLMGIMSGSVPWYTMMVLHRRFAFFQSVRIFSIIADSFFL